MRIHTNTASSLTIMDAAHEAGVTIARKSQHGSRTHARAFEVILSGSGVTGGQWGSASVKTATWDEWGMFLAHVFMVDPTARTRDYENAAHFRWATTGRYSVADGVQGRECRQHKWQGAGEAVTGSYYVSRCSKCGSYYRRLSRGVTWEDVA